MPPANGAGSTFDVKYDAWNRLVEVKYTNGTVITTNEYDGLNRRIIRDESGGSGELRHLYYNNQWQVLVEAEPNNVATTMYSYHPQYVDAVAVRIRDTDAHIYLHDANYNVTAVMNDTGSVVERYAYMPYGKVTVLNASFSPVIGNTSTIANEYLYTGRRRDPETGLQINRWRFYNWQIWRWVNRDPIGYEGRSMNLYEYVGSFPNRYLDRSEEHTSELQSH